MSLFKAILHGISLLLDPKSHDDYCSGVSLACAIGAAAILLAGCSSLVVLIMELAFDPFFSFSSFPPTQPILFKLKSVINHLAMRSWYFLRM